MIYIYIYIYILHGNLTFPRNAIAKLASLLKM